MADGVPDEICGVPEQAILGYLRPIAMRRPPLGDCSPLRTGVGSP